MEASVGRAVGIAAAAWHLLVVVVLVVAPDQVSAVPWMVVGHLIAGGLYVAMAFGRLPASYVLAFTAPLCVASWWPAVNIDRPEVFASAWLQNLTVGAAAFLLPRVARVVVPIGIGVSSSALVLVHHRDWPSAIPISYTVTAIAMTVIVTAGGRYLRRFGAEADAASAASAADEERAVVARTATQAGAESARMLHDTAINTLGFIATGGSALADTAQVRRRCELDLRAVTAVAVAERADAHRSFEDALTVVGIDVRRGGANDQAIATWLERVSAEVRDALLGAVREAVANAARHSGAAEVLVLVRLDSDRIDVEIRDGGVGFDPEGVRQRGLAESIRRRTEEVGVESSVASAPGRGTTVRLRYHRSAAPPSPGEQDHPGLTEVVAQLRWRVCWLWAWGVTAVGVLLQAGSQYGQSSGAWINLAVMAAAVTVAFLSLSFRRWSAVLVAELVLTVATPLVFRLSLSGIDAHPGAIVQWQALSMTAPGVLLLTRSRRPWLFWLALGATGVVAAVTDRDVHHQGLPYSACVPIGFLAGLGLLVFMRSFRQTLGTLGTRAAAEEAAGRRARLDIRTRQAAAAARSRWRAAGLDHVIALLEGISGGLMDPSDPSVRAASGREEQHLRQILTLSPELVHLGAWAARLSSIARVRAWDLSLRLGDTDVADDEAARRLSRVLDPIVESLPDGTRLVVAAFPDPGRQMVVTLVADVSTSLRTQDALPAGWSMTSELFGHQTLVQVGIPHEDLSHWRESGLSVVR
jgi:hypothetical protein